MKYGNIGKAIAFASLWFYAATIYPHDGTLWETAFVSFGTFAGSVLVIFIFDSGPEKKTE